MAPLPALLFAPARLTLRFLDDVSRAAVGIARAADAVEGINRSMEPLDRHVDELQAAFDRSNEELAKLRHAFIPHLDSISSDISVLREEMVALRQQVAGQIDELDQNIAGLRDVVAPLQGATERVGRAMERLPGGGRR